MCIYKKAWVYIYSQASFISLGGQKIIQTAMWYARIE